MSFHKNLLIVYILIFVLSFLAGTRYANSNEIQLMMRRVACATPETVNEDLIKNGFTPVAEWTIFHEPSKTEFGFVVMWLNRADMRVMVVETSNLTGLSCGVSSGVGFAPVQLEPANKI